MLIQGNSKIAYICSDIIVPFKCKLPYPTWSEYLSFKMQNGELYPYFDWLNFAF